MLTAIKYNLRHLTDFNGRDARSTFWLYVLFLVIVQAVLSFAISIPLTGSMMGDAMGSARQGLGEAEIQQGVFAHMGTMMRASMWASAILSLVMIGLLLAAFVRRLHDASKPAWIAYVAALFQFISLVLAITSLNDAIRMVTFAQTGDLAAAQAMQGRFFLQGLLSWIPLLLLVIFGVWPSHPQENRYGPPPLAR